MKEKNKTPFLIFFYADWCGPCKITENFLKILEKKYKNKVQFYKVDIEKETETAIDFQLTHIPAVFFFKDEELIDSIVGAAPLSSYEEKIEKILHFQS